jgi:valyl-tRNA synthetase
MAKELPKTYEPKGFEHRIAQRWVEAGSFDADPDERGSQDRYVIMMPLPNVTGALHMGHAMDNVMQDLLIRWNRMKGKNTLWQPGTDHAGIATQAVVEKRLFELEGKTRHDIGRESLVQRIWEWKDEYQARIVRQQQAMGCSCDWRRQRFTMDPVCSAAVREAFFRLFCDRLIYRGSRLVNWDCQLQTAVADDEVYHETVAGHFWHIRYPVVGPESGEPGFVVVATTRPETMLGDTAVACHPSPAAALEERIEEQREKLGSASPRDRESAQAELGRLEERKRTHLEALERLAAMAKAGRKVLLPLMDREIPLVLDEWAKPELGSGCVKITPGHDPNDYAVWQRHRAAIGIINILSPDGSLNENAGAYARMDRFEARQKVIEDLKAQGLLERVEDWETEIGHSDRSKTPIEPYLSKQWFVRMRDVPGGLLCGRGTDKEFTTPGLAQAAIDAVEPGSRMPTRHRLAFHPPRYTSQYVSWLTEKRDWCISRQLWWGHRIPVWAAACSDPEDLRELIDRLPGDSEDLRIWIADSDGGQHSPDQPPDCRNESVEVQVCLRNPDAEARYASVLESLGLNQDPDVLDTWFSSALWPFSTLGWPDPAHAAIDPGQRSLGPSEGGPDSFAYYYPGSCLVTARDIISLWVARMVIMGLYNHGVVPFVDCFVHAKILDGKGETMSKSRGNGIDPVDVIERYGADAMRYLICDMETGMQDVRLPVQATCPDCNHVVELSEARHGQTIFTYLCTQCSAEFDVLGTMKDVPPATVVSDRFEVGRGFCNKLWNAARFALLNLGELRFQALRMEDLAVEDRWILSRLNRAIDGVEKQLTDYSPSTALSTARDFFWGEFCDWYLELIKPRMRDEKQAPVARQVLAATLDQTLRLLHPFVPFVTEVLWEQIRAQAPVRGVFEPWADTELCMNASWPQPAVTLTDEALEEEFALLQQLIGSLRELRARHNVPPSKRIPGVIKATGEVLRVSQAHRDRITEMARLSSLHAGEDPGRPKNAAAQVWGEVELFLGDVLDPDKEKTRLVQLLTKVNKQLEVSRKKLSNDKFLAKAPADVVETERKRLNELESELQVIQQNLRSLEGNA